jgi:hypothetical protein
VKLLQRSSFSEKHCSSRVILSAEDSARVVKTKKAEEITSFGLIKDATVYPLLV